MTKKRRRNKKWISWLIWLILFVVGAVVCYLVWDSYFREKSTNTQNTEEVEESKKENVEMPEKKEEEKQIVDDKKEEKKVEQYDGEDPNDAEALSGVVTYAGVNGEKLMIRVNIDQYLGGGQCKLELMKDGITVYNNMANIVGGASTATCEGFDVPVSEIGRGALEIVINVSSGDRSGIIRGEMSI